MMKRIMAMLMALLLFVSCCAVAEEATLSMKGAGVVTVTADRARVVLGVRESSADVLEAQGTVNAKINAIVDALLAAGVDKKDISTESLYIYANYDYSQAEEILVGYTASNTISILTVEMDKVGEYIDIAFGAGANTLDMVEFTVQDNEAAQKEALELAVQNAFEKAEIAAKAAGMKIAAVRSIEESDEYYYNNVSGAKYSNVRTEAAAGDMSTMVQASSLQIRASVKVEFEICEVEG